MGPFFLKKRKSGLDFHPEPQPFVGDRVPDRRAAAAGGSGPSLSDPAALTKTTPVYSPELYKPAVTPFSFFFSFFPAPLQSDPVKKKTNKTHTKSSPQISPVGVHAPPSSTPSVNPAAGVWVGKTGAEVRSKPSGSAVTVLHGDAGAAARAAAGGVAPALVFRRMVPAAAA